MPLLETAVPALNVVWFLLIAVLWIGFFFLEGFDFGVAMLLPVLGRNDKERRVMVNTIGPVGVTHSMCSHCADRLWSLVTTVQPSSSSRTRADPAVSMGSMASTMPGRRRGPLRLTE